MSDPHPSDASEPGPSHPVQPLQLSYRAPETDLREAWEGSISPFSKIFVAGLLIVLFAGSLLAIVLLFVALLRG